MHAAWWMLGALAVLAIAYRYYSAFLAAKVLCLDDARVTPAHRLERRAELPPDEPGRPVRPSLRRHHGRRAAHRAGARGAVRLLPGLPVDPLRRRPRRAACTTSSSWSRARAAAAARSPRSRATSSGPTLGVVTAVAILFIVVIALAGLGNVVVGALAESAWGVFTVGASIPIALVMGLYIYNVRGGSTRGHPRGDHRRRRPALRRAHRRQAHRRLVVRRTTSSSRSPCSRSRWRPTASSRACCRCGCCSARATTSRAT